MDPQENSSSSNASPPPVVDHFAILAANRNLHALQDDVPFQPASTQASDGQAALEALEEERLAALHSLAILDTQGEEQYDDLTSLASFICGTPMALISLVDKERQWFKSRVGIQLTGTPRSESICAYTIQQPGLFMVEDATKDPRFASMPLVAGGVFRFYAGAPINTDDGHKIGSLCVLDDKPRELSQEQQAALLVLSRSATAYLRIRGQVQQLLSNADERRAIEHQLRQNHGLLEEANRQLQELATTDALTGLPNRRILEASLLEQQHGQVKPGRALSLMMIDVDHFKRVNDTYSHEAGDVVLQRVAGLLRSCTRETDLVSRYGGEEFVVLLRGASHAAALVHAERLRAAIAGDAVATVPVTISIGVATASSENWHEELPLLLAEADKALYVAKHDGRNRVRSATMPLAAPTACTPKPSPHFDNPLKSTNLGAPCLDLETWVPASASHPPASQ